jgi:hypothetical protein
LVIEPFVAVKLVVLTVPVDRLATPKVPVVMLPVDKLVAVIVPAVKLVTVNRVAVMLPIVMVSPASQLSTKVAPPPAKLTLALPMTEKHVAVLAAAGAACAFCIGNVITNPELTNSVAKTLLILVCADRCVVVILDIFSPLKVYVNVISELFDYSKTHEKVECNTYCCKNV